MKALVVMLLVALLPQLAGADRVGSADRIVWVGVDSTQARYLDPPEPEAVAAAVVSWPLAVGEGVGQGIVMDRLVKREAQGCGWVVFFDLSTHEVHFTERKCRVAEGFGFRNYWFHPVKTMLTSSLGSTRRRSERPSSLPPDSRRVRQSQGSGSSLKTATLSMARSKALRFQTLQSEPARMGVISMVEPMVLS